MHIRGSREAKIDEDYLGDKNFIHIRSGDTSIRWMTVSRYARLRWPWVAGELGVLLLGLHDHGHVLGLARALIVAAAAPTVGEWSGGVGFGVVDGPEVAQRAPARPARSRASSWF
ncbi:hypothetical protein CGRA01v4_11871 [Colletotrichum graminicola]|nr:hypothetical protein CGRA01v4_11871 [Colletotrichum graminicola]